MSTVAGGDRAEGGSFSGPGGIHTVVQTNATSTVTAPEKISVRPSRSTPRTGWEIEPLSLPFFAPNFETPAGPNLLNRGLVFGLSEAVNWKFELTP